MNKRLIKKMLKKKEAFNGFVYAEGNNGGDYIKIENKKDGLIHLEVGSSCIVLLDKIVPVEFMTGVLNNTMFENDFDINKIIDNFGWEQKFKDKLKEKVI